MTASFAGSDIGTFEQRRARRRPRFRSEPPWRIVARLLASCEIGAETRIRAAGACGRAGVADDEPLEGSWTRSAPPPHGRTWKRSSEGHTLPVLAAPLGDRVMPRLGKAFAGFGERHFRPAAQAEIATPACHLIAEDPRPRSARAYDQEQPAPVRVTTRSNACDLASRERHYRPRAHPDRLLGRRAQRGLTRVR